jgi:hypothetical protein
MASNSLVAEAKLHRQDPDSSSGPQRTVCVVFACAIACAIPVADKERINQSGRPGHPVLTNLNQHALLTKIVCLSPAPKHSNYLELMTLVF